MSGEHFVPFRKTSVVAMCAAELPADERDSFVAFTRMLASLLHHRYHERIDVLKDAYHPFNPDADTRSIGVLSTEERRAAQDRLERELAGLAVAANFTEIDPSELTQAFGRHSLLKVRLEVDLGVIDKVMFFRRGESTRTVRVRTWWGLRRRTVSFTNYARVLVYAKFKDEEHFAGAKIGRLPFVPGSTIVKLFQNVPRADLEMVLPNVEVRMRLLDKVLIGIPAMFSGVAVIATKLVTSLALLVLLVGFWMGLRDQPVELNQTALVSLGAGLAAFGGYLVRQVTKFKNRKIRFMKALSENLYFRNLDNDAGVFHHLLDAAEEAEVIEAVLGYHFLRTAQHPLTPSQLDQRIEEWFASRWQARFDFEIEDGVRKLREFGLVTEPEEGRLRAVSLPDAKRHLDLVWDGLFDVRDHAESTALPSPT
ncbi:MAG TPA: TMEM143 family protein [Micromonosporaceae bacterium]